MDTVPGAKCQEDTVISESTISRFACRILVDRDPPYNARIYAAGFNSTSNIFLGVSLIKKGKKMTLSYQICMSDIIDTL